MPNITARHCLIRFAITIACKDRNLVVGFGIIFFSLRGNYRQTAVNTLTATAAMPADTALPVCTTARAGVFNEISGIMSEHCLDDVDLGHHYVGVLDDKLPPSNKRGELTKHADGDWVRRARRPCAEHLVGDGQVKTDNAIFEKADATCRRVAACFWMTNRRRTEGRIFLLPLGSVVLVKSRFAQYFESLF
jgi:hypothetical protein